MPLDGFAGARRLLERTAMTDLSRLEPKNGDFVRYVDDLIRRQQAEMLRTRGDEAAAMRASLRDAFDAMEATDRDGDGFSL